MNFYANHIGYSDVTPYEVIKRTAKTITIREMKAEKDPTFKTKFVKGGFAGVCVNQCDQKWIITPDEKAPLEKAYLRKDGYYWSKRGKHVLAAKPAKYYDFNF